MSLTDIRAADGTVLFSAAELACRATGDGILAPGFAPKLIELRLAWARPMTVNSCCRSARRNVAVNGHPHSLHIYDAPFHPIGGTAAIDIAVAGVEERWDLGRLAYALGWSIGVPRGGFIHLDRRDLAGLSPGLFGY